MELHDIFDNGQAQAGAGTGAGSLSPLKMLPRLRLISAVSLA